MKVKKLIRRLYKAILQHNAMKEKKIYMKLLRKSLKHKKTQAVYK